MKNRIVLSLIVLLSSGKLTLAITNSDANGTDFSYADKKPIAFMKDFLDITKEPNKPFKWWVAHLIHILKGKKEHEPFLREFLPAYKARNANRIGLTFMKYKDNFEPDVVKLIKSVGVDKVREVLKFRTKQK